MKYEYLITVVGFSLSMYHPIMVAPITPPKGKIAAIKLNCWVLKPAVFKIVGIQLVKR